MIGGSDTCFEADKFSIPQPARDRKRILKKSAIKSDT